MTLQSIDDSVEKLALWSLHKWSLAPSTRVVLEFINFRGATEHGRNHAMLAFTIPGRIAMTALKRNGGDIGVKSARVTGSNGERIFFEMDALTGGRAEIEAREYSIVFY
jgi:hypothetical protein